MKMKAHSTHNHFKCETPFKVQLKFDIPLFEGQIDMDTLEKWLSLLEGYFSIQIFSNTEKITCALLKSLPHVIDWWEMYYEKHAIDDSAIFWPGPILESFFDALKEKYFPIRNYHDQYMRWTTLHQKRD
jgi:hypothetical protein